jgi:hypothetical protein
MTPINGIRFRAIVGTVILFLCCSAQADEWELPKLMQRLMQNKEGKASFVEKKYIGILDKPLLSSGELAFTAPDRLEKRTIKPKQESFVLEGARLRVEQAGKAPISVNLQDHPEISAFTESIRGTLAGDQSALEKFYALELTGSADSWTLVLRPKPQRVRDVITLVRIGGTQGRLKTIHFEQQDGDHSEMRISYPDAP